MSRAIAAIVLSVLVVATACGSSDKTDSSGSASGGSGGAFPVTVKSALGSATIDKNPKRVVAIGWGSQDAALALGVVPVGMEDLSADSEPGQKVLPWEEQRIKDLKGATPTLVTTASGQVPFEKIAALHPDVILAVYSGITGAQFAKLSDIAPTVGYPDKPWETSWQDQIALVGRALGLTPKATVLAAETNKLISNAAKEHPEFRGKTITFGSGTTAESYNFYYDDDPRLQLLKALGFTLAPSVSKLGGGGSSNSFAKQVSVENLGSVKTDVLVSWYLSKDIENQLEHNKLFQSIPAVKHGGYIPLTDPPLVFATSAVNVLSLPWMLHTYLPLLSKAAASAS